VAIKKGSRERAIGFQEMGTLRCGRPEARSRTWFGKN